MAWGRWFRQFHMSVFVSTCCYPIVSYPLSHSNHRTVDWCMVSLSLSTWKVSSSTLNNDDRSHPLSLCCLVLSDPILARTYQAITSVPFCSVWLLFIPMVSSSLSLYRHRLWTMTIVLTLFLCVVLFFQIPSSLEPIKPLPLFRSVQFDCCLYPW
jgi:hypothetical protein